MKQPSWRACRYEKLVGSASSARLWASPLTFLGSDEIADASSMSVYCVG